MASSSIVGAASGHVPCPSSTCGCKLDGNKFSDETLHEWFVWRSECPKTAEVALAHFRTCLKSLPPQSQVDGKRAVFRDSVVFIPWKRPATVRAAHMFAYRTLKDFNFKDGEGTWMVDASDPSTVFPEVASIAATSRVDETVATWPLPSSGVDRIEAFPTSPALKLLRGGDKTGRSESRYVLGAVLGKGTYGTVVAASVGGRSVVAKRFCAEDTRQAKIDAAEVIRLRILSLTCVSTGISGLLRESLWYHKFSDVLF